ncbi:MAG: cysteine desulfurase, partial [Planctomycetales bacterium]|nr:cysteine desulfurase [Planctomycetales bacterium]
MIYLDNHATTPLDPAALAAMLPLLGEHFANAGSVTHAAGRAVAAQIDAAIADMARMIGAADDELVITSGATESNNLALLGACLHPRQTRRKVVSVVTEHKAVLDPLSRLKQHGFEIELLPVSDRSMSTAGRIDLDALASAVDDRTALVSVMLANNEIGTVQPLSQIAELCRAAGCLLHTDATQAVGRMAIDVDTLDVDLLSFSAHKFYGPKGVGGLFVRRRGRRVKMQAQIVGGGQQHNFRSGTLNTAGIVGMHAALASCLQSLDKDQIRVAELRDRLLKFLQNHCPDMRLNGPTISVSRGIGGAGNLKNVELERDQLLRLPGNLNCCFYPVEGQSLMLALPDLAASSGSACTSANPSPSHVLQAIGLSEEEARSSLRFGIGRFNTQTEI